jgi:Tol biopolymer transport system component
MRRLRTVRFISLTACALSGVLGIAPSAHAVVDNHLSLVSVATPEVPGDNGSYTRAISDDGRFVLFASSQPNLVPGDQADPNGRFLYLRDLQAGTTTRLSHGTGGFLMGNAAISADGGYVAFASKEGTELVSLRLYNRATGTTMVISKPPAGEGQWYTVAISDDGHYVDYTRTQTNSDDAFVTKMYRYDVQSGVTTQPVTGKLGGTVYNPDNATIPSTSANGRFVTFVQATAPAEATSPYRLVRLDTTTGVKLVIGRSAPWNIPQNAFGDPSMSNDGRYIAYATPDAAVLVSSYVYDATTGTSELVSHNAAGNKANAGAGQAQISGNGRYVTFSSAATDIVPGVPAVTTIYVYDRQSGTAEAIVKNRQGVYPGGAGAISSLPYIDGDGSTVAFTSQAQNLSVGANSRLERVYAWQRP